MSNYAPLFIPTLCRYSHLKKCIDSLLNNSLANQTHLFIALDYPLNEVHKDGYLKILNYINELTGFKEITLIKRSSNYGAVRNSEEGLNEIFRNYDRIIFSEDDNEFSPNFLAYMNQGLEKYAKSPLVYAISGYSYPISISNCKQNTYIDSAYSAWGVGLWKRKYNELVVDGKYSKDFACKTLSSFSDSFKILKTKARILDALMYMVHQDAFHGDTVMESYLILENKYSLFPTISKVKNWGHDGSGVHCNNMMNDIYARQKIDSDCNFQLTTDIDLEKSIAKSLKQFNGQTLYFQIKVFCKYIKYRLSL